MDLSISWHECNASGNREVGSVGLYLNTSTGDDTTESGCRSKDRRINQFATRTRNSGKAKDLAWMHSKGQSVN